MKLIELQKLRDTFEGCQVEFLELESTKEWFATQMMEDIEECLSLIYGEINNKYVED